MHKSTGSFAPKTLKFKNEGVKQLPYSDQPTAQGTHCREMLFTPRCSLGVREFLNYFGQPFIRRMVLELWGVKVPQFSHFCLFFQYKLWWWLWWWWWWWKRLKSPFCSRPKATLQNASSGRSGGMPFASGIFQRRLLQELVPSNLLTVRPWEMPLSIKHVATNFCQ